MDSMQGDPMTWQPQPQPQPVDPPKKRRARRLLTFGAVALGAFLIGLGAGGAGKSSTVTSASPATTVTAPAGPAQTVTAPEQTVTVAPAPPPPPPGPATKITKDGVYVVGTDIAAGKWKTTGPRASTPGYFAVLKDPAGSTSDVGNIVTNDNPAGQAFVTLKAGQGFSTSRLDWEKVS